MGENKRNKIYGDSVEERLGIQSFRIPDYYVMTGQGKTAIKKPCDRLFMCSGIAAEFKKRRGGLHENLKSWREHPKKRHQCRFLQAFGNSGCGLGVLIIFWTPAKKNRIQTVFLYSWELNQDKVAYSAMHPIAELEEIMKRIKFTEGQTGWQTLVKQIQKQMASAK